MSKTKNYFLTIKPALIPEKRHEIEECLEKLGYLINGGGTMLDMSQCDISFSTKLKPKKKETKKVKEKI
jgi:hypothetical protein